MKLTLSATVIQAVTDDTGSSFRLMQRNKVRSMFLACEGATPGMVQDIATHFGEDIRVTFEAGEPADDGAKKDREAIANHPGGCECRACLRLPIACVAPPLVNGRPSCCKKAKGAIYPRWRGSPRRGGWFTYSGETECAFCPFCGACLPEVP